jgi:hypothetical protein
MMRYLSAIVAGLLSLVVIATPVAADQKPDHQNGPPGGPPGHSDRIAHGKSDGPNGQKKNQNEDTDTPAQRPGLHLGELVHDLTGDQSNELADKFDQCTTSQSLQAMGLGDIKHLAHAAGISTGELKDLLKVEGTQAAGLGQLVNDGLEVDQADALSHALDQTLESSDLQELPVGKILQAAHACGLDPGELVELLRES